MAEHHFGEGHFKKELWIAGKTVFTKPIGVDVEMVNAGAFDWVFADATGKEVRTLHHKGSVGWTSMDFSSLGMFENYSIGFRNAADGERVIKQGVVRLP